MHGADDGALFADAARARGAKEEEEDDDDSSSDDSESTESYSTVSSASLIGGLEDQGDLGGD